MAVDGGAIGLLRGPLVVEGIRRAVRDRLSRLVALYAGFVLVGPHPLLLVRRSSSGVDSPGRPVGAARARRLAVGCAGGISPHRTCVDTQSSRTRLNLSWSCAPEDLHADASVRQHPACPCSSTDVSPTSTAKEFLKRQAQLRQQREYYSEVRWRVPRRRSTSS